MLVLSWSVRVKVPQRFQHISCLNSPHAAGSADGPPAMAASRPVANPISCSRVGGHRHLWEPGASGKHAWETRVLGNCVEKIHYVVWNGRCDPVGFDAIWNIVQHNQTMSKFAWLDIWPVWPSKLCWWFPRMNIYIYIWFHMLDNNTYAWTSEHICIIYIYCILL